MCSIAQLSASAFLQIVLSLAVQDLTVDAQLSRPLLSLLTVLYLQANGCGLYKPSNRECFQTEVCPWPTFQSAVLCTADTLGF